MAESIAAPGRPVAAVEADHPSRTTTTVSPTPASTESSASISSPAAVPIINAWDPYQFRAPSDFAEGLFNFAGRRAVGVDRPHDQQPPAFVAVVFLRRDDITDDFG